MNKQLKKVTIYTSGVCKPNPGPGGRAAIVMYTKGNRLIRRELSGYVPETNSSRIQIQAAIQALQSLDNPSQVEIFSNATYLVNGWRDLGFWMKNNWKLQSGGKVANQDLWLELWRAAKQHKVNIRWISAYCSVPENERVHRLANQAMTTCMEDESSGPEIDPNEWQAILHMRSMSQK